jgi:iron complex transport system substrate-binding protein
MCIRCRERIVGVTRFAAEPPEARMKPKVGGFSKVNYAMIDELRSDLVITFSDVQADAARELIRRGHVVLATNQRSLKYIFNTILLIGRAVGREFEAQALIKEMRTLILSDSDGPKTSGRPNVYFEEWNDPFISGIRWVSELIEYAGGCDILPELRERSRAADRVVTGDEIIRRQPEIIVASWCGKKVDAAGICKRAGWEKVPAVRNGRVYEVESAHILQPGPSLLEGFRQLREIIRGTGR